VLLAALLLLASLIGHVAGPGDPDMGVGSTTRDPSWWTIALVVLTVAPIAWRRVAPLTVAAVVVTAQAVSEIAQVHGTGWISVLLAFYTVGAHTGGRRRTVVTSALFGEIALLFVAGALFDDEPIAALLATLGMSIAAFLVGDHMQSRRRRVEELAERAERAERERELLARERVVEERARIARELHDVVAHSVSVMVIQAAAARRNLSARPDQATELLTMVETTGRQTMDELRRILGVLRDADGDTAGDERAPQPTLAALPELVATDPDLPVELVVDGHVGELPPGIALSAYRVVQEALTNVRRHAGPVRRVRVHVTAAADHLDLRVDDDGRGAAADRATAAPEGTGFGLIGMRERIVALGGTLDVGPRRGGGWRVHARVPLGGAA
jgi:signal transduction histidine kinase